MLVADVDPNALRASGALLGAILGAVAHRLADALPARYGIRHRASPVTRARRRAALVVLASACSLGIAHVLVGAQDASIAHAAFLLATNATLTTVVLAAAAIDLEHMILPNELTIGGAVLAVASSPLRSVGLTGSIAGAVAGFLLAYAPFLLYKKLRGQSGMGLGDAKLAVTAGAWHGILGAVFVLFAGALQSTLAAVAMRLTGLRYEIPESVQAELADLRARAAAGDEEARLELADDPMAADTQEGVLGMRLPLGPFLALACIETLFFRRWLSSLLDWLMQ